MLTDLEICKRIAEIEGLMFCDGGMYKRIEIWKDGKVWRYEDFNPLTDDALCFQLMVKYEVSIDSYHGITRIDSDYTNRQPVAEYSYMDITVNKAICLAIIEANSDV